MRNEDRNKALRSALRRLTALKYLVLAMAGTGFSLFVAYQPQTHTWDFAGVWANAVQGIGITLVVTIFFDLFVRREQALETQIDREDLVQQAARDLVDLIGANALPPDQRSKLLRELSSQQAFAEDLAGLITDRVAERTSLAGSYLVPFLAPPVLRDVSLTSRLFAIPGDTAHYRWLMRHQMTLDLPSEGVRIIAAVNPAVANSLLCSDTRCDHLVLLPNAADPNDFIGNEIKVTTALLERGKWRSVSSERELIDIERLSDMTDLADEAIAGLLINFQERQGVARVIIEYEKTMSSSDPYFYNSATSHVFAKEIMIDYSGISGFAKNVSALSFISSPLARLDHNVETCEARAQIDGLLLPGEGIVIVWRPPEGDKNAPSA